MVGCYNLSVIWSGKQNKVEKQSKTVPLFGYTSSYDRSKFSILDYVSGLWNSLEEHKVN